MTPAASKSGEKHVILCASQPQLSAKDRMSKTDYLRPTEVVVVRRRRLAAAAAMQSRVFLPTTKENCDPSCGMHACHLMSAVGVFN